MTENAPGSPSPAPSTPPSMGGARVRDGGEASCMDKAWQAQSKVEQKWDNLGKGRFARVLRMARKPEPEEFRQSAGIVLVGIAVIGGIGFAVYLFMGWLMDALGA